ncbi:MAG: COG1361 S-layer family protein, partial [Natronomonas sp.]
MSRNSLTAVAVAALFVLLAVSAGTVVGQQTQRDFTRGEPDISAYAPDAEVTPGSDTRIEVQLQNSGDLDTGPRSDEVLTARAVSVAADGEGPLDVRTGRTAVGSIPDGSLTSTPFQVVVPEGTEPGTYELDVKVRYSYVRQTSSMSDPQRRTETERQTVDVRVVSEPRFAITDVDTDVQPGTSGDASVTIENVGSERANATRVT